MPQPVQHVSRHRLVGRHVLAERAVPVASPVAITTDRTEVAAPMTDAQVARVKKVNIGGANGQGFFDRMFVLPPLVANENDLEALANAMRDVNPNTPTLDNQTIPPASRISGSSSITTSRWISAR